MPRYRRFGICQRMPVALVEESINSLRNLEVGGRREQGMRGLSMGTSGSLRGKLESILNVGRERRVDFPEASSAFWLCR